MQQEDIVSGFVAIITLVLNLIPTVTGTAGFLTADQNAALLSLAVLLKAVLGDITIGQPAPVQVPVTSDSAAPIVAVAPTTTANLTFAQQLANITNQGAKTAALYIYQYQGNAIGTNIGPIEYTAMFPGAVLVRAPISP